MGFETATHRTQLNRTCKSDCEKCGSYTIHWTYVYWTAYNYSRKLMGLGRYQLTTECSSCGYTRDYPNKCRYGSKKLKELTMPDSQVVPVENMA